MTNQATTKADSPDPDSKSGSHPGELHWIALFILCLICIYLIFTSTINILIEIPVYDSKRIAEFFLMLVAFLTTLTNPSLRQAFACQLARVPRFVGLGLALFFALGIASSFINSDSLRGLIYSLIDVGLLGLLLVLMLIVAACRNLAGRHFDRVAVLLLAFLGLAVGFQELAGYWAAWSIDLPYSFDIALPYFSFPRMYNQLQTWTIPVLAAIPFLFPRNRLAAFSCVIALGLHWCILLVTGARGSVVSLLVAFAIASFFSPVARLAIIKWQFIGILLGILLYAAMFEGTETGRDPFSGTMEGPTISKQGATADKVSEKGSFKPAKPNKFSDLSIGRSMLDTTGRSWLWKTAASYAYENPLLGIGPMNFACKGPAGRVGSPHNLAFQILSEWGIPALIILTMLGFLLIRVLLRSLKRSASKEKTANTLQALLVTAVLAALVHLMVSSLLLTPASQITGALIAGWLLGLKCGSPTKTTVHSGVVLLSVVSMCGVFLMFFSYHETIKMPEYRLQLPAGEDGRPRLWQLGRACSNLVH